MRTLTVSEHLTCQVVHQVLHEVADDGVERHHYDDGSEDDVEDVNRQMNGVSSRWDVSLEENLLLACRGQLRRLARDGHDDTRRSKTSSMSLSSHLRLF